MVSSKESKVCPPHLQIRVRIQNELYGRPNIVLANTTNGTQLLVPEE